MPSFPPVTIQLLQKLSSETVDLQAVGDLVESDPALLALTLSYANSALYGGESPVLSVSEALLRLGVDRTREVLTTLAASSCFRSATEVEEVRRCWRHTLASAIIADEIARCAGRFVHQAYTAALLHDLGSLALAVAYRDQYVKLIQESAEKCMDLLDYEATLFGAHHADAGRWLVYEWKLPAEFRETTGRHHDTPESRELTLLLIVHVACLLADAIGFDVCPPVRPVAFEEALDRLPPDVAGQFRWDPEALRRRVEQRFAGFADVPVMCPAEQTSSEELAPVRADVRPGEPPTWILMGALVAIGVVVVLWWPH